MSAKDKKAEYSVTGLRPEELLDTLTLQVQHDRLVHYWTCGRGFFLTNSRNEANDAFRAGLKPGGTSLVHMAVEIAYDWFLGLEPDSRLVLAGERPGRISLTATPQGWRVLRTRKSTNEWVCIVQPAWA